MSTIDNNDNNNTSIHANKFVSIIIIISIIILRVTLEKSMRPDPPRLPGRAPRSRLLYSMHACIYIYIHIYIYI